MAEELSAKSSPSAFGVDFTALVGSQFDFPIDIEAADEALLERSYIDDCDWQRSPSPQKPKTPAARIPEERPEFHITPSDGGDRVLVAKPGSNVCGDRPYRSSDSSQQPRELTQESCSSNTALQPASFLTTVALVFALRNTIPEQEELVCFPECGERRPDRSSFVAHLLECAHISDFQCWRPQSAKFPAQRSHASSPEAQGGQPRDTNEHMSGTSAAPCARPHCRCSRSAWSRHNSVDSSRRRKAHPLGKSHWDKYKGLICRMYMEEKQTLQDLKCYMQSHHNFFATERQYRSQLARWNCHKRIKKEEINYILQQRARGKQGATGQSGQFVKRRGEITETIPEESIRRWEARTGGIHQLQIVTEGQPISKPPDIDCVAQGALVGR